MDRLMLFGAWGIFLVGVVVPKDAAVGGGETQSLIRQHIIPVLQWNER